MSIFSVFIDHHLTHDSERRAAHEKAEKATAEFDALKEKTKKETERLETEKKFENDRREKKNIRRLKGGRRRSGFLNEPASDSPTKDTLG